MQVNQALLTRLLRAFHPPAKSTSDNEHDHVEEPAHMRLRRKLYRNRDSAKGRPVPLAVVRDSRHINKKAGISPGFFFSLVLAS